MRSDWPNSRVRGSGAAQTDGFDIVAVRIEDEGAVVVRAVLRSRTGSAVVPPAGIDGGSVEGVHVVIRRRGEGDMERPGCGVLGRGRYDPESRTARRTIADDIADAGDIGGKARLLGVAEGEQGRDVEVLARGEIAHVNGDMVEHGRPRVVRGLIADCRGGVKVFEPRPSAGGAPGRSGSPEPCVKPI